ncbi:MAG: inorganic phosphate transporter, partial [Candidatus Hadarchaeales archaeon]
FISWILNPFVSACLAFFASRSIAVVIRRMGDLTEITRLMFVGLIVTSAFTAYTFGANDLGASTGVFYAFFEDRGIAAASFLAAILAWVGTVAGAITLGRKVSRTVESGITRLDPFTAFSAQLGTAIGVWAFVQFHIPVSTTQAFVGGLMGAGMAKGVAAVNSKKLGRIAMTWIIAPVLALLISLALSLAVLS